MRILRLALEGAKRAPLRYLITAASISVGFTLFGLLFSASASFDYMLDSLSDNTLRVNSRVNLREPLPIAHLAKIEGVPGVLGVEYAAIFSAYYADPKNRLSAAAVAADRLQFFPGLVIDPKQQQAMQALRTGAIAGRTLLAKYGWKVGDRITLISSNLFHRSQGQAWDFDIVGVWDMPQNPDLANEFYVNYEYVNEARAQGKDTANIFIVQVGSPELGRRVAGQIDATFANSGAETLTRSDKEWVGSVIRQIGDVHLIVYTVLSAALFTLLLLTRNSVAQSVRERVRDFGVLKVLGFTNVQIGALILVEALLLCVGSASIGLAASTAAFPAFAKAIQFRLTNVPPTVAPIGFLLAVALAIFGAAPSAARIAAMNPAEAVSRE